MGNARVRINNLEIEVALWVLTEHQRGTQAGHADNYLFSDPSNM